MYDYLCVYTLSVSLHSQKKFFSFPSGEASMDDTSRQQRKDPPLLCRAVAYATLRESVPEKC